MLSYSNAFCFVHPHFTVASAALATLCALELLVCNKFRCTAVYGPGGNANARVLACRRQLGCNHVAVLP